MRTIKSICAIIAVCTATVTVNAGDLPVNPHTKQIVGVGVKTPEKTPIVKIAFSTSLLPPPPLAEDRPRGGKPEEKAEEKKPLESKAGEPTDSRGDRTLLLEESLTLSVGSIYNANLILRSMDDIDEQKYEERSILAKSTWDLGSIGVWKIGQGELDPVNEENIRASIGLKPLRPLHNPEIAFTDRITLSERDGLKIFFGKEKSWSVGLKAGTSGGTIAWKLRF